MLLALLCWLHGAQGSCPLHEELAEGHDGMDLDGGSGGQ